jgi:hypothetical protein
MSFLLSVTFFSGVYSVTLYFHGSNLNFSCVNNLHNLKERSLLQERLIIQYCLCSGSRR